MVGFFLLIPLVACQGNLWGDYHAYPTAAWIEDPTSTPLPFPATATVQTRQETPTLTATKPVRPQVTGTFQATSSATIRYLTQAGDSLETIATRFSVQPEEILASTSLPEQGFLPPGLLLLIPNRLDGVAKTPSEKLLPDSEVVYSPSTVGFEIEAYVQQAGGYLAEHKEYLAVDGWTSGAGCVRRIALESSINPRLLLAYIEYKTGWVTGQSKPGVDPSYPLAYGDLRYRGLYQQLRLLVQDIAAGYYSWRAGTLTELKFPDGQTLRLAPELNAGTVALQYLFSRHHTYEEWLQAIDPETGFLAVYRRLFGDPWELTAGVEPLFPPHLIQPPLTFPFEPGRLWSFTGGPHAAWEKESALAALDFAPAMAEPGCGESPDWVVAVAPGLIVRSGGGYVILDLDGDGYEQTGWVILYMHIAKKERIPAGVWVNAGDRIGHPSCEGGIATGTHVHIARKYNGEWIGAGGPVPFVLSGWTAHQGDAPYFGTLTKGDKVIISNLTGSAVSQIIWKPEEDSVDNKR
ncbi:MAG: M23 family metallopeptidase [Anaerolineales bacterium]|nr:M23 family metallopeptidase [Anaerolineales bacterium]MCX7609191.1 M23 family metallopeptidase [Anaerolineales bacterium]MDW8227786.1 M23 family metallopeptidase [Anaerolineales bacterium]